MLQAICWIVFLMVCTLIVEYVHKSLQTDSPIRFLTKGLDLIGLLGCLGWAVVLVWRIWQWIWFHMWTN